MPGLRAGIRPACAVRQSDCVGHGRTPLAHRSQGGTISIDTPRSQALVGFVRSAKLATTHLSAEIANDFAAITLSSLDRQPLRTADRLLLTATARTGNTGQQWNDRRSKIDVWGTAPTWIDPVKGWLMLRDLDGMLAVSATPLDGAGKPVGPAIKGRMQEDGWEIPDGSSATTAYLITVARRSCTKATSQITPTK